MLLHNKLCLCAHAHIVGGEKGSQAEGGGESERERRGEKGGERGRAGQGVKKAQRGYN